MSEVVSWNLQLNILDGRLDEARALMTEMVEAIAQNAARVEPVDQQTPYRRAGS